MSGSSRKMGRGKPDIAILNCAAMIIFVLCLFGKAFAEDKSLNDVKIRGADSIDGRLMMLGNDSFRWAKFLHDGDGFCHVTSNIFSAHFSYKVLSSKAYLEVIEHYPHPILGSSYIEHESTIYELTPGPEHEGGWRSKIMTFYNIEDVEDTALPFPSAGVHFILRENCGTEDVVREDGSTATVNIGNSDAMFQVISIGFSYGNLAAQWRGMDFDPGDADGNFDNVNLLHEGSKDYIEFTTGESGNSTIWVYCRKFPGVNGRIRVKVNGQTQAMVVLNNTDYTWVELGSFDLPPNCTIRLENAEDNSYNSDIGFKNSPDGSAFVRILGEGEVPPSPPPPAQDTTPPNLSNIRVEAQANRAWVKWETDEPATSVVEYGTSPSLGLTKSSDTVWCYHAVVLTDLIPNTTYRYKVISVDESGNRAESGIRTFTTPPPPDTVPPALSGINLRDVKATSVVVEWTTNEPANSVVEYGKTSSLGSRTSDSTLTTTHRVQLIELSPNTTYYYKIISIDAAGNQATTTGTFKTPPPPDTTPPTITGKSVSNITETSAQISWTTNEPSTSVVEYGTTTQYGSRISMPTLTKQHSVQLTDLLPGQIYHYRVSSTDVAGNTKTTVDAIFKTESSAIITGKVSRKGTNMPVSEASVFLEEISKIGTTTDSGGIYTLTCTNVPAGSYTLIAVKPGYEIIRIKVQVKSNLRVTKDIAMIALGTISGTVYRVVRNNWIGLNGVTITANPGNRTTVSRPKAKVLEGQPPEEEKEKKERPSSEELPFKKPQFIGIYGYYEFVNIPLGTYTLRASLPGFQDEKATVTLSTPGQVVTQDFLMKPATLGVAISDVTHTPASPKPGQRVTFNARVYNDGGQPLTNIKVRFMIGNTTIDSKTISSLQPGKSSVVSCSWTLPSTTSGQVTITVIVDPDNAIAEANENNNIATHGFIVSPLQPDLSISASEITFTPTQPMAGDNLSIKAKVCNLGSDKAQSVKVSLYRGQEVISEKTISSLKGGETSAISFSWKIPENVSGEVILTVLADPNNSIAEANETNNSAQVSVNITPRQIDLSISDSDVTHTPATPKPNENVSIKATVKNTGNVKAINVKLRFIFEGNQIGEKTISSIQPGKTGYATLSWKIPSSASGTINIQVVVDPENKINEPNEGNNSVAHAIPVATGQSSQAIHVSKAMAIPLGSGNYLSQNYPNPFSSPTTIEFRLANSGIATLKVYDITGRLIRVLVKGYFNAGTYKVVWDGRDESGREVASGVYLFVLRTQGFTGIRKGVRIGQGLIRSGKP